MRCAVLGTNLGLRVTCFGTRSLIGPRETTVNIKPAHLVRRNGCGIFRETALRSPTRGPLPCWRRVIENELSVRYHAQALHHSANFQDLAIVPAHPHPHGCSSPPRSPPSPDRPCAQVVVVKGPNLEYNVRLRCNASGGNAMWDMDTIFGEVGVQIQCNDLADEGCEAAKVLAAYYPAVNSRPSTQGGLRTR